MSTIHYRSCLIYSDRNKNSNKFYISECIERCGMFYYVIRYGRLGKEATVKEKLCSSKNLATRLAIEKSNEKSAKGYVYCDISDIAMSDGSFYN